MRQIFRHMLGLSALLLLLPACKSNDIEEPSLELSTSSLTFAKAASEQTLSVQTNKDSWNAFSAQEGAWLTLEQQGNTLRVKVTANDQGSDRSSVIIVNAGGLQKRVAIRQSAGDAILDLNKTKTSLEASGGTEIITYSSNAEGLKIEVTTGSDWLSVDKMTKTSFTLTAKENTGNDARTGKITLTLGTTIKEVEVEQEGKNVYILPYLDAYPATFQDVNKYELSRGSSIISAPDGLFNKTNYRYATKSKVMPILLYEFKAINSPGFSKAVAVTYDVSMVKDNPGFDAFIGKYGFVKGTPSNEGKTIPYTNDKLPLQLTISILSDGAMLTFAHEPRQQADYPTFKELPQKFGKQFLGSRDLQKEGKKRDFVKTEEEKLGSTVVTDLTSDASDFYEVKTAHDGEFLRGYFLVRPDDKIPADDPYIDVVDGLSSIFRDIHLAFWQDETSGDYNLTKEVIKFFGDNKFVNYGKQSSRFYAFYSAEQTYLYLLRVSKYGGKSVLEMQGSYFKLEGSGGSVRAFCAKDYQDKHNMALKQINDRIKRLNAHSRL